MDQASTSIAALCEFKKSSSAVSGATLFDRPIRFDEATGLISVKDFIVVIEGVTSHAATMRIRRLKEKKEIVISEGATTGFMNFIDKYDQS